MPTVPDLRDEIYATVAATGRLPTRADLVAGGSAPGELDGELQGLHDRHEIVLGGDGEIAMALPFSATSTPFVVRSGGVDYWANCAWDSLAVPIALHRDAEVDARWGDGDEPFRFTIRDGRLEAEAGLVHFSKPARRWWDDIADT